MVIANGCPKSGTHALMEWLQAMGLKRSPGIVKASPNKGTLITHRTPADPEPIMPEPVLRGKPGHFIHGHLQPVYDYGNAIVVTMIRDPRNVLASFVRWWNRDQDTGLDMIGAMDDFLGQEFVPLYRDFLDWRGHMPVIRYEDMPRVDLPGVYEGARADRSTWNDEPTDWREWWGDEVQEAWEHHGGPGVLAEAGYA